MNKLFITGILLASSIWFSVSNSYAFSSRDILDTNKTVKSNDFFTVDRSVLGNWNKTEVIKEWFKRPWAFLQNTKLTSWSGTTSLDIPKVWSGTLDRSPMAWDWQEVGWSSLSDSTIWDIKNTYTLKGLPTLSGPKDFPLIWKTYSDFINFMYQNTDNTNITQFLLVSDKKLTELFELSIRSIASLRESQVIDDEKLEVLLKINSSIIPTFKKNIQAQKMAVSSFDWFIWTAWFSNATTYSPAYIFWSNNNIFSFSTSSTPTSIQKISNNIPSWAKTATPSTKNNQKVRNNYMQSQGAYRSPNRWSVWNWEVVVADLPTEPPDPQPAEISDAEILAKAREICESYRVKYNSQYINWAGMVRWDLVYIYPGNVTNPAFAIKSYRKFGTFNSPDNFCGATNWCNGSHTPVWAWVINWNEWWLSWNTCKKDWPFRWGYWVWWVKQ